MGTTLKDISYVIKGVVDWDWADPHHPDSKGKSHENALTIVFIIIDLMPFWFRFW